MLEGLKAITMNPNPENNLDPQFERELKQLLEDESVLPDEPVPERVDSAVMAMIDAKVTQIQRALWRRRISWVFAYSGAAAAAAVLILGAVFGLPARHAARECRMLSTIEPTQPQSGPVDIVDAYLLACRLRSGERLPSDCDHNNDGLVDTADVDELARRAVCVSAPHVNTGTSSSPTGVSDV